MSALIPARNTCQATILIPIPNPTVGINPLRYLIGSTIVAGQTLGPAISITAGLTTAAQIQNLINADATYLAYLASNPGFSITVSLFDATGLTVIITKPSTSVITDNAIGVYSDFSQVTSSFTCNIVPGGGGGSASLAAQINTSIKKFKYPKMICCKRNRDILGNLIPCKQEIYYPSMYGKIYVLISSNDQECCYQLKYTL